MLSQTIGHYRIQAKIGAGGMGEVYRATDSRLGRDVALKVLPEAFANDADRMARFEREARVLASLNHPNIAALYGFEESNGTRALVMELVEGPMLAERIQQGPPTPDESLQIAKQIAEALEYAHERGIIHRDLKPSNVKLTSDGHVKLVDFGLAKALEGETSEAESQNSPTLSAAATRAGVMLGTAAYMAPEQARGKRVDRRADIWAFGCVLFEMLAGRTAFEGETTSDILACVIRAEPDWNSLPLSIPPQIRDLLRRCLQKDTRQRLQAIGEARIAIESALAETPVEPGPLLASTQWPRWRRAFPWALAFMATAAAVAIGALHWRTPQPLPHPSTRASLLLPEPVAGVFSPNPGSPIALSPDGAQLVFVGGPAGKASQLYVRRLDEQTSAPIRGTDDAIQPFFSTDGQWLAFFSDGKLRKVSVKGGSATELGDALIPHGGNWGSDDTIVFAPNLGSGLMRISSAGGAPKTLTTPDARVQELSHRWPQVLPGNKTVLFTIQTATQVSYDEARIALLSLDTGKWRTLFEGGSYARYVPSGHIVYAHAGTLMAVPFDLNHLQITGSPGLVQDGVITTPETSGSAEYDIAAESGLLAYVPGSARPPERKLVWVDRQGIAKELPSPVNAYVEPRISPDGKSLVVQILNAGSTDLWIYEFARNALMRLTFGTGSSGFPVWTPDGRKVIYRARVPALSFRAKLADGSRPEETLFSKELEDPGATPSAVSPDAKTLLFGAHTPGGTVGTYAISLDGNARIQPFLQAAFNQSQARFSPDGRWVVYVSNESSRQEVYVQPFPGSGGKWMISTEGGSYPVWARNGREIFFRNDDKMMSVPVEIQPTFKSGTPRLLFQNRAYLGLGNYDVAADGQHFLMLREKEPPASSKELSIIFNWPDDLTRRAPSSPK